MLGLHSNRKRKLKDKLEFLSDTQNEKSVNTISLLFQLIHNGKGVGEAQGQLETP